MPTPYETLIAAAEACEAAVAAYESADAAIKAANERKSQATENAESAIRQARSVTRNRDIARGPGSMVISNKSQEQIEAERYRHMANDCRQMAELFNQG